jgi:MarR family transcriptional regulator, organic hydroperoxide resistance regulator
MYLHLFLVVCTNECIFAPVKQCESKYCHCAYFSVTALSRKVTRLAEMCWKPSGLSPSLGYLLLAVLDEPGVQPGVLSKQLQLAPSTISRLMEKLEQKKLLLRTGDGKLTNVYPTPRGKQLYIQLSDCRKNFHEQFSAILGEAESNKLVAELNHAASQLEG